MRITVITVCYNSVTTLGDTLASVRAQRFAGGDELEHLVIDGGSTDGTLELLKAAKGIRWQSERDRGLYDAINKGIRLATGEVVGILNSDDVFDGEDALAAVAEGFRAHPEADAIYADIRFVRDGRTVRYYSAAHWRPWMARWGYMVPHPSVYVKRERFAEFGGYSLDYDIAADFELMTRYFVRHRLPTAYLARSLVKMRPGGKSTAGWRAYLKANRENVRALRANSIFSMLVMMLPKYAYKICGLFRTGRRASAR